MSVAPSTAQHCPAQPSMQGGCAWSLTPPVRHGRLFCLSPVRQHFLRPSCREQYESMVAQVSGVAEDVRMKDAVPTSLGRMDVDQRGPENKRVKEARQMAASTER